MITVLRAELVRLHTLRSSYAVPLALFVLVASITAATTSDAGSTGMSTPTQLREPMVTTIGIVVAISLALLAATRVAGEYRNSTISLRLLAAPRRTRLLAATLIGYVLMGLLVRAVALGIGLSIALPILDAKRTTMAMTASDRRSWEVLLRAVRGDQRWRPRP